MFLPAVIGAVGSIAGAAGGLLGGMGGGGGGGIGNPLAGFKVPELEIPEVDYNPTMFNAEDMLIKNPQMGSSKIYGTKPNLVDYKDRAKNFYPKNIPYQSWDGIVDFRSNVKRYEGGAQEMTDAMGRVYDAYDPNMRANARAAGQNINAFLSGEIPQDVVDTINRNVAERAGAAVNPYMLPGIDRRMGTTESTFARDIGRTSLDLMNMGMNALPAWQQMSSQFVFDPQEAFAASQMMAENRYKYDVLNTQISMFNTEAQQRADENLYTSKLTKSFMRAAPDPRYAGYLNDYMNITSMNNAQDLAKLQFEFGHEMNTNLAEYARTVDQKNVDVAGAMMGAAGM